MTELDLPQEDMEFLENISKPKRDPALQQCFDDLQQAAKTGDEFAKQSLESLLVAESTTDEFRGVMQQLMNESVNICQTLLPEIITFSLADRAFMGRLADTLQAIQRSAFAYGWIARDRKGVDNGIQA